MILASKFVTNIPYHIAILFMKLALKDPFFPYHMTLSSLTSVKIKYLVIYVDVYMTRSELLDFIRSKFHFARKLRNGILLNPNARIKNI